MNMTADNSRDPPINPHQPPSPSENPLLHARVVDAAGQEARIAAIPQSTHGQHAWLQLADGVRMRIPLQLLEAQDDGSYRLPFALERGPLPQEEVKMVIPVVEEILEVNRQQVDTGGVRLRKTVEEREELVQQPLRREELAVEHVPLNRVVTEAPQIRYEGETLVVPVLEEVLVVQKKLLLREEVRITRQVHEDTSAERVTLRSEHLDVQRFTDEKPASP